MSTINAVDKNYYKFQLSFKGKLVENSVDAYDVANTILATSNILQEIAEIKFGTATSDKIKINIHAFKEGSLVTDFILHNLDTMVTTAPALIPMTNTIFTTGKDILTTFKTYLDIKKALKGEQPAEIKALSGNKFELKVNGDNNNVTFQVNAQDLRVLQSKTIEKNTEKIVQPLTKPDSLIEEIEFTPEEVEPMEINKEEASYLGYSETVQTLDKVKYKGVISKIDTKANSGYIDIGSKRLPFNYPQELAQDKFDILIESLRTKIQVYVIGSVTMDYESNPKQMLIFDVESEIKLFEE